MTSSTRRPDRSSSQLLRPASKHNKQAEQAEQADTAQHNKQADGHNTTHTLTHTSPRRVDTTPHKSPATTDDGQLAGLDGPLHAGQQRLVPQTGCGEDGAVDTHAGVHVLMKIHWPGWQLQHQCWNHHGKKALALASRRVISPRRVRDMG